MNRVEYVLERLKKQDWLVGEELPGDEHDITGRFIIEKRGQSLVLEFEGMNEIGVLPLEQSYACHIQGHRADGEYISGKKIPRERRIEDFVKRIDTYI